ncbi:MAG: ribonuclease H-like domain-containing protein [Candidatus Methanofastidiosia archaeon]
MISSSFIILERVGFVTERKLWRCGIRTWDDFIGADRIERISQFRKEIYDEELLRAKRNLEIKKVQYFSKNLHKREHWRLYEKFKRDAVFFDIETTGLNPERSKITTVSLYDGKNLKTLVHGHDLTRENLKREFERCKLLVSFYGSVFDLPFIEKKFGIKLDLPHFDLCFASRRLGLKGGLKVCEKIYRISRAEEVRGIDGLEAVRLWHRYERGSLKALRKLIKYNQEDTKNLLPFAEIVYKKLYERIFRF